MKKIEALWLPEVQQQIFRSLMEVMSRPGKTENLAAITDGVAPVRALLATLLDAEVSLSDHHYVIDAADWPLLQAKSSPVEMANYVVCRGEQSPDFEPMLGTLSSPEHSATIVLVVDDLTAGNNELSLSGPGVNGEQSINISGLNQDWLSQREEWNSSFPLGIDLLLVDNTHVMALPRTTICEVTSWDM